MAAAFISRAFDGVGAAAGGAGGGNGLCRCMSPKAISATAVSAVLLVSPLFLFYPFSSYSDRFLSSFSSTPKDSANFDAGVTSGERHAISRPDDVAAAAGESFIRDANRSPIDGNGSESAEISRDSVGSGRNPTTDGILGFVISDLVPAPAPNPGVETIRGGDGSSGSFYSRGSGVSDTRDDASKGGASEDDDASGGDAGGGQQPLGDDDVSVKDDNTKVSWDLCRPSQADYIPCLDNWNAIKRLKSRRHMEHRERHCPVPAPHCLVALPTGYKIPVPWPKSRDMIWYDNVPHPKLVEFKKDQHWVQRSGDYLIFPGGGTQFKNGVSRYIRFVEQVLPAIGWGSRTRVVLDVGCGVASFGGSLLEKNVITMSFAPKDEHEAQIQFALERGIPAILAVIGTKKLPFPDNSFDLIHCARCRVHWDADGGKPLLELNRLLRPGGYYIWSATPVYRHDQRDEDVWKSMVSLTTSICWKTVAKSTDANGIGLVIYQKPSSNSCYYERQGGGLPLCSDRYGPRVPWYEPLDSCLPLLPRSSSDQGTSWPLSWPHRLNSMYRNIPGGFGDTVTEDKFNADTTYWSNLLSEVYFNELGVNWSTIRNVMDMNSGFGGFAAALADQPLWVMNVVPVNEPDTLSIIYNRGLIGVYHDWCESFNTYPRTYDLLHLIRLESVIESCNIIPITVEMDRMLRPGGWIIVQGSKESIKRLHPIIRSLQYEITSAKEQLLVAKKGFWRPNAFR